MHDYAIKGLPDEAGYIISAVAGAAIMIILFKVISSMKKYNVHIALDTKSQN